MYAIYFYIHTWLQISGHDQVIPYLFGLYFKLWKVTSLQLHHHRWSIVHPTCKKYASHLFVSKYIYIYVYIHMCVQVYIQYTYIYIAICIYIYTWTYVYIYTYYCKHNLQVHVHFYILYTFASAIYACGATAAPIGCHPTYASWESRVFTGNLGHPRAPNTEKP